MLINGINTIFPLLNNTVHTNVATQNVMRFDYLEAIPFEIATLLQKITLTWTINSNIFHRYFSRRIITRR